MIRKVGSVFSRHVPLHSQRGLKKLLQVKWIKLCAEKSEIFLYVFFHTFKVCINFSALFSWEKGGKYRSLASTWVGSGYSVLFLWSIIIACFVDWLLVSYLFHFRFLERGKVSISTASTMAWLLAFVRVERNRYQEIVWEQDILHLSLEQVPVQIQEFWQEKNGKF